MDVSWLTLLMSTAVFFATVLLAVTCMNCRTKGPLVSISQTISSEEQLSHSRFIVIHPSQPHPDQSSVRSPSNLLTPHQSSLDRERSLRPYTPTETESNPSYENPVPETDGQDSDPEDNGYIKVLPETDPTNSPSRASTPSSDNHQYVNVEEVIQKPEPECDTDSGSESNYQNVEEIHHPCLKTEMSSRSEDDDDEDDDDDDDDEGNYVNQLPMIH